MPLFSLSNFKFSRAEVFLLLLSCVFSLYVSEAVLRVIYTLPQPIATYYPLEAAKLGKTIQIRQYEFDSQHRYNSEGFRDKEIIKKKFPQVQRILFVGDSFTEGFGVQENERFSNKLIEMLGTGYEGINAGQLATNPDTYFNNIANFGVALRPDLIVMGIFMGNDFMGGRNLPIPDGYKVNLELPIKKSFDIKDVISLKYVRTLWQQTINKKALLMPRQNFDTRNYWEIYYNHTINKDFHAANLNLTTNQLDQVTKGFNQNIIQQIYEGKLNTGIFGEAINNQLGIKEQIPYYIGEDYEKEYAYIKEASKVANKYSIKFLVLIIPDVNQVHPVEYARIFKEDFKLEKPPARFHQLEQFRSRLNSDLRKDKIVYVDSTNPLKHSGQLTYYLYDNHMNKLGHTIVAETLRQEVARLFAQEK